MQYSNISVILEKQLNNHEYDQFIYSVINFYIKEIKSNEDSLHYENCFNEINPYLEKYGRIVKNQLPKIKKNNKIKICYVLPSLDTDLAHIEVLFSILKNYTNRSNIEIYIAGESSSPYGCHSKLITQLAFEKNIKIINFSHTHKGLADFLKLIIEEKFSQLIIVSVPILLPFFITVLGANYVTWHTLKFTLNCFKNLKNGICGYKVNQNISSHTQWHINNSVLNEKYKWNYEFKENNIIKFISINREEKIKNTIFLEVVKNLLIAIPNSTFDWTGRNNDEFINSYFLKAGLIDRVNFIGWVDPLITLKNYDIFLDTPNLSGLIAASSFAAGMPTIFFKNSRNWIEAYEDELNKELVVLNISDFNLNEIISNDAIHYIENVVNICTNTSKRKLMVGYQHLIAKKYFFDSSYIYNQHFTIIRNIINQTA
jgi:hypothetical protein